MSTKLPEIISDQKNASPYIPGVTGINGFGGTILYDSNVPGNVIAPGVINSLTFSTDYICLNENSRVTIHLKSGSHCCPSFL